MLSDFIHNSLCAKHRVLPFSMPECTAYDSLPMLLSRQDMKCHMIQIGASSQHRLMYGHVPDTLMLQFICAATGSVFMTDDQLEGDISKTSTVLQHKGKDVCHIKQNVLQSRLLCRSSGLSQPPRQTSSTTGGDSVVIIRYTSIHCALIHMPVLLCTCSAHTYALIAPPSTLTHSLTHSLTHPNRAISRCSARMAEPPYPAERVQQPA
jgi:hypothetical protein